MLTISFVYLVYKKNNTKSNNAKTDNTRSDNDKANNGVASKNGWKKKAGYYNGHQNLNKYKNRIWIALARFKTLYSIPSTYID